MLTAPKKGNGHGLMLGLRQIKEKDGEACDFTESTKH